MDRDKVMTALKDRFEQSIVGVRDRGKKRVYLEINAGAITEIADYVFRDLGARFNTASAVDGRNRMEILYHFTLEEINLVLSFRVYLPKTALEIASLSKIFTAAQWIEREIHEMFGIDFIGHPQLERLLLPEDWPERVYPLRKDYEEWDPNAVRDRGV